MEADRGARLSAARFVSQGAMFGSSVGFPERRFWDYNTYEAPRCQQAKRFEGRSFLNAVVDHMIRPHPDLVSVLLVQGRALHQTPIEVHGSSWMSRRGSSPAT